MRYLIKMEIIDHQVMEMKMLSGWIWVLKMIIQFILEKKKLMNKHPIFVRKVLEKTRSLIKS